jgi:hypothetical protein
MKKNYINSIKEVFIDKESLTPEKFQSFMGETVQYLSELRVKLGSTELKEREEAIKAALELKEVLETQMIALSQSMGIDLSQLSETALVERMGSSEREAFDAAKEQFDALKNSARATKKNKIKPVAV